MNVVFLDEAEADVFEALAYYEEHGRRGSAFLAELQRVTDFVRQYPFGGVELCPGVRRFRLDRFPYGVGYEVRGDSIRILAVLNVQRDPESWMSRLKRRASP
jgi:plasmid stabilization system protein ParE